MPHITIKLFPGRTDEMKAKLGDKIVKDVAEILGNSEDSISLIFEEVAKDNWKSAVYDPEIVTKMDRLHKKPGYKM